MKPIFVLTVLTVLVLVSSPAAGARTILQLRELLAASEFLAEGDIPEEFHNEPSGYGRLRRGQKMDFAVFRESSGLWAVVGLTRVYFGWPPRESN